MRRLLVVHRVRGRGVLRLPDEGGVPHALHDLDLAVEVVADLMLGSALLVLVVGRQCVCRRTCT